MTRCVAAALLTAITYSDGDAAAALLARIACAARRSGITCSGFLERKLARPDRSRCDMSLECLLTGDEIALSEDRGVGARGCRLDVAALMRALSAATASLASRPDLLIVNKFGKTEGEGRGFRPLIAAAIEQGVPVLIAVPWRNIDSWRLFAGDLAVELSAETLAAADDATLLMRLGLTTGAAAAEVRSAG